MGDPHYIGFDYVSGPWKLFPGAPGKTYNLFQDGTMSKLDSLFAAGGPGGKATFIRGITFSRGPAVQVSAMLNKIGKQWKLAILANGNKVAPYQSVRLGTNVVVEVSLVKNGAPSGIIISTPYMRIRAVQRAPYKPEYIADPLYGEWLDVYITLLQPLVPPVTGLLGSTYKAPPTPAAATAATQAWKANPPTATFLFEQPV